MHVVLLKAHRITRSIQTLEATWKPVQLVIPPVWFLLSTAHRGLPIPPWMHGCSFLLHRATCQTRCLVPLCPFLGPCPPCCWSQICSAAVTKSKQQLTGIDGWGLLLHLFTDKCFNLSVLRNHIDWRDFVLFLRSVSQKDNSSFNIFLPWAWFHCTFSGKSFIFKAQGKWSS